jgi:hypothetical protein
MLVSKAKEQNNKRTGEEENLPTASFSSLAPVVVHRTNRSIRPFDFLNMNDYSAGVRAKADNRE